MIEELYSQKHWEILIETIVDRIGVGGLLDTTAYVLQRKYEERPNAVHLLQIADEIDHLVPLAETKEGKTNGNDSRA